MFTVDLKKTLAISSACTVSRCVPVAIGRFTLIAESYSGTIPVTFDLEMDFYILYELNCAACILRDGHHTPDT